MDIILIWLIIFIAVILIIINSRNERKKARETEREWKRKYEECERRKKEKREKLAKLNQQKQEIEKQVFKEDEYNLYVNEGIIEKMCSFRLRNEYTVHSYILYEKLLEDIGKQQ